MKPLYFATTNSHKFRTAQEICSKNGLALVHKKLNIHEVQSEDGREVLLNKGNEAYSVLQEPVLVSDDSWAFLGLKGFPGPYMHSINKWFTDEDFLRLTRDLSDKRVVLTQSILYISGDRQEIFTQELKGTLLNELRGNSLQHPSHRIISLDSDNGLTIAERLDRGFQPTEHEYGEAWEQFAEWYKKLQSTAR